MIYRAQEAKHILVESWGAGLNIRDLQQQRVGPFV